MNFEAWVKTQGPTQYEAWVNQQIVCLRESMSSEFTKLRSMSTVRQQLDAVQDITRLLAEIRNLLDNLQELQAPQPAAQGAEPRFHEGDQVRIRREPNALYEVILRDPHSTDTGWRYYLCLAGRPEGETCWEDEDSLRLVSKASQAATPKEPESQPRFKYKDQVVFTTDVDQRVYEVCKGSPTKDARGVWLYSLSPLDLSGVVTHGSESVLVPASERRPAPSFLQGDIVTFKNAGGPAELEVLHDIQYTPKGKWRYYLQHTQAQHYWHDEDELQLVRRKGS